MRRPRLIAVAHGTRCGAGQAQVRRLVEAVRARRPGLRVDVAYLDIERPHLSTMAARLDRPAVAVPLLFAAGYHVSADIPAALADAPVTTTRPLAPDPALVTALLTRLRQAGALGDPVAHPADAVVLAAAGSSDPRAQADVRVVAAELAGVTGLPARAAYASAADPRVREAVAQLRAAGARRVAIAAMLLADGQFYRSLASAGADVVTRPLGRHPAVVDLILSRYERALAEPRSRERVLDTHPFDDLTVLQVFGDEHTAARH